MCNILESPVLMEMKNTKNKIQIGDIYIWFSSNAEVQMK